MYKKTNYLITSNRNQVENISIFLSSQPIARTSHPKLLGVFVYDKLNFDKLCSKVSQSIEVMKEFTHQVPVDVL